MDTHSIYYQQVSLLIRMLPVVAQESVFALKGGTAINLFIRNFPRLSVDIDLAYLPLEPRDEALRNAREALLRITANINALPEVSATFQDNKPDELRIVASNRLATIKIEVSPVARGTLYEPEWRVVAESVEDTFGFAEIQVVSMADLYGGKLCAAMDRQHPRDLFDVNLLLHAEGITRNIFNGFITYVLGHPRPMNEVMSPNWQPLSEKYQDEFEGMTVDPMPLSTLEQTREWMLNALKSQFTPRDKDFLMGFKKGEPNWSLFDVPSVASLPAIQWKLLNLKKLKAINPEKHDALISKLESVTSQWLQ